MLALGLGMAISVAPLTTTVMNAVEQSYAGAASGINNAVSRVAGLLAIALFGGISIFVFARALENRLAAEGASVRREVMAQSSKLAEAEPPKSLDDATRRRIRGSIEGSFLRAFRVNMLAAAGLAGASALAALGVKRGNVRLL